MTILQALNSYYDRMAARGEAELPGWSREKFGFCIVLMTDGSVVDVQDLRDLSGKKPAVKLYQVPASFTRPGVTPRSFFLWDKTAFSLGISKGGSGGWVSTPKQHDAFKSLHTKRLANQQDEGLVALRHFLESWQPTQFDAPPFREDMIDANIMFRLDGDRNYLHERPAAKALVQAATQSTGHDGEDIHCLITGERGPAQRLHPTIKGVEGAQSSGAALVSFNLDAFTSLGMEQGANAPTSQAAAFRYGAALNRMLDRGSGNRVPRPIGDASVVFWADASDAVVADAADDLFASWLRADEVTDAQEARKIVETLDLVAKGRPVQGLDAGLADGTRFHILGLSPNAARLSVRFWETGSFRGFAQRLAQHFEDMRIEPLPYGWRGAPSVNRILAKSTALQEKFDNIPHALAGEMMRAVLTGGRYPQTLLSAALMRLRAGDSAATGWHAAVIKAVLCRSQRQQRRNPDIPEKGETPVALNRAHENPGYQLGRLFAIYELAQRAALGKINATIRDKYFGAASATPASIFPLIIRGGQNHLAKVRKEKPGWSVLIERELEEISGHFEPQAGGTLPRSLGLVDQGEFAIGYYHQRATKLTNDKGDGISLADHESDTQEDAE